MTGPLAGLRVIELAQYISGPFAGKLLADLGADVLKVESPSGDPMRRWEGGDADTSPQFAAYNRNKSGLVLDLKTDAGRDELTRLVATADVLIENFRPGVTARLGVGYPELERVNPRLIVCSITGFGPDGPYAGRPAYDTVISALSGMYSQVVPAGTMRPLGPAFSDLLSGMSAAQAVLAALHARQRTGRGEHVEVSMLGSVVDFLTEPVSTYLRTGEVSQPDSRPRRAQAFACVGSDGGAFVVHLSVPEKFWTGLLDVLERPDLAHDPRFATRENRVRQYDALDAVLKEITAARPREHWLRRLTAADIPHAALNGVEDLLADPQVAHLALTEPVAEADGREVLQPRLSTVFHRSGAPGYRPAPPLAAGEAVAS
ncbi:CaiB/BaiF CoA-transferase family protein [Jiangella sp. DSM 45060]|uniref:CaiB/BaiF CoA transferase family protein n=1 Tax=Jiangella sp. DSM 45060 TaxID=1798224 RepID=UPI00087A295B|nr:CaiB/BaiF CoA-transferase family protein [Jiangella sp. DSM 45060]SDT72466.1 formyl-CoA transferase [Jiangella sp. DSM 45060]